MSRLRDLRCARFMTQRELARKARVAPRTVCAAERSEHGSPQMTTQRKLLRALGLPFAEREAVFGPLVTRRRRV